MRRFVLVLAAAVMCSGVSAPVSGSGSLDWRGTVDRVVDGDTVKIDIAGDGKSAVHVRNAGIQAMETGQCGASAATNALAELVRPGQAVVLRARRSDSTSSDGTRVRPLRHLELETGLDVQLELLRRGLVLAYPLGRELTRQDEYHQAAQQAAQKGLGLYSRALCAPGPQQNAQLRIWVNWDADGYDPDNLNGEYVRILNEGGSTVDLAGWWLRSPTNVRYRIPAGTAIPAGRHLTVHSGSGRNTSTDRYWGGSSSRFYNPDPDGVHNFGAYLFDPDGDLRSWSMYPCTWGCSEPLSTASNVSWTATYDPPGDERKEPNLETANLTNTSAQRIDASYRVVTLLGRVLELGPGTYLDPGETLRVHMGRGSEKRLHKYLGSDKVMLANTGGSVVLRNTEGVQIGCAQWGDRGPAKYRCASTAERATVASVGQVQLRGSLSRVAGSVGKVKVNVDPNRAGSGSWSFDLERHSGATWVKVGTYRTRGSGETRSFRYLPSGTYRVRLPAQSDARAAVSPTLSYSAPHATVSLRVARRTKLKINAGPALSGSADFRVKIQRRSGKRWVTHRKVRTAGKSERATVNVPRGTYRVRVSNQRGYLGVVSAKRYVAR